MSHNLLIRLIEKINHELALEWQIIYSHPNINSDLTRPGDDKLPELARTAQNIIVTVPGTDTLITSTNLPKLSLSRLKKAIPLALEDKLIEDTEKLHFAIGPRSNNMPLPVAVTSKEKMKEWQVFLNKKLGKAAQYITTMLPESLALPYSPDNLHIYCEGEFALARTNLFSAFKIKKNNLFDALKLLLKQPEYANIRSISLHQASGDCILSSDQITELGTGVNNTEAPEDLIHIMTTAFDQPETINLLQDEYAPVQQKLTLNQLVWSGFIIAGFWLIFATAVNFVSYAILYNEKRSIDDTMVMVYKQVFPNAPIPDDPKLNLQKQLSQLRANRTNSTFMRLVYQIGAEYKPLSTTGLTINKITYNNSQIVLDIEANNLEPLNTFQQKLETHGLNVQLSNAERNPAGLVEMRFTIEESL